MERWIIIINRAEMISNLNCGLEFFLDFSFQGLLRGFTWFHFSAWKLPAVLEISVSALCSEDLIIINNYCCNYLYIFQYIHLYYFVK